MSEAGWPLSVDQPATSLNYNVAPKPSKNSFYKDLIRTAQFYLIPKLVYNGQL